MLSSTLKRSTATVSIVVAGLLAAAGPANAQFWEGKSLTSQAPKPSVVIDLNDPFFAVVSGAEMTAAVKAPASSTFVVLTSVSNNLRGEAIDIIP
jgi:hypothetical protein